MLENNNDGKYFQFCLIIVNLPRSPAHTSPPAPLREHKEKTNIPIVPSCHPVMSSYDIGAECVVH